jgi:hypothetical protein
VSLISKIVTLALLALVFRIAGLFTTSNDWRDRALGWIVIIVYIFIGVLHAIRFARRN